MSADGHMCIPKSLEESGLSRVLTDAEGREEALLSAARDRVVTWTWSKEDMFAHRTEPLFAERFDSRTPPEKTGEPTGPAVRFGRDRDGLIAVVDIGYRLSLSSDRGLRFAAWHSPTDAVLLNEDLRVVGVERRLMENGRLRAFARFTAFPNQPSAYQAESYDYDDAGRLTGIRTSGHFYLQVIPGRGRRSTIVRAPKWAPEPYELSEDALDELEERLRARTSDRVLELLTNAEIVDEVHYLQLYGRPAEYLLVYATAAHCRKAWAKRRYRPFDFYLLDVLSDATPDEPHRGFGDLVADSELFTRELIKRRQWNRLESFSTRVALTLNQRPWPVEVPATPDAVFIACSGVVIRKVALRMIRESVGPERWATLEEQENARAEQHGASRPIESITKRSAEKRLLELAQTAGFKEGHLDAATPGKLFDAFTQFLRIEIRGVEQEQEEVAFEAQPAYLCNGDVEARLVRQLSLHDQELNYLGMETVSIDMTFPADGNNFIPNDVIWADKDRPGSWSDDVRASPSFRKFFDGSRTPTTVLISQNAV